MKKIIFALIILTLIPPSLPKNLSFEIICPRSYFPAIVEKGKNFEIIIEKIYFNKIEAKIETAYEPIIDEIYLEIENYSIKDNIYINAKVPFSAPCELYNLTVIVDGIERKEEKAINVVENISGNFKIAHISDLHVGDPRGVKINLKEKIGSRAIKKCIEEINLIKPDFAIITGDLVFGAIYEEEYEKLYEILQEFDIPVYLCPGNHDGYFKASNDGFEIWNSYFGFKNYSFSYGKAHFIIVNSYDWDKKDRFTFSFLPLNWGGAIRDEQIKWIEEELKKSNYSIKFICLHHNPLWDTKNNSLLGKSYYGREKILDLIKNYNVNFILAGHIHADDVTFFENTTFITTTTPSSSCKDYWGYRIIEFCNWSIYSLNYKEPKYSIPSYMLNYTYEGDKKIIVENNLEINLTVHLKFFVEAGNYKIINGSIEQIREKDGFMEIYVRSEINAKSIKEIYLI
ncbi:MAG: metallophosphoesterase [Candidatus Thermoplasmatota archaeon]